MQKWSIYLDYQLNFEVYVNCHWRQKLIWLQVKTYLVTLILNDFRLTKKWQKQSTDFLYTLLTAYPNVNLLLTRNAISKIRTSALTVTIHCRSHPHFTNCSTNVLFQVQHPDSQIAFSCPGLVISDNLEQYFNLCLLWSPHFWVVLAHLVEWPSTWVCPIRFHDSG